MGYLKERKKRDDNFREAFPVKTQVRQSKFLGNGVLREYGRNQYCNGAEVHSRPRKTESNRR